MRWLEKPASENETSSGSSSEFPGPCGVQRDRRHHSKLGTRRASGRSQRLLGPPVRSAPPAIGSQVTPLPSYTQIPRRVSTL